MQDPWVFRWAVSLYVHVPVCESEECHGDYQIAQPVDSGGYGDGSTAGPRGIDLRVDSPGQGAHARGKKGNVEKEHNDCKRGQPAVRTSVAKPLPLSMIQIEMVAIVFKVQ